MENRRSWKPTRSEDFQESDLWDLMAEPEDFINGCRNPGELEPNPIGLLSRQLQSSARMIPRAKNPTPEPKLVQQSAPVNIPDWSKIYGKSPKGNSSRSSSSADQDCCDHETHDSDYFYRNNEDDDDEDYDEDQDGKLPPHEWLARKHTRNQISSFSMCKGAGRTLKGRDLSRGHS